jgi:hypothetical protein
VASWTDRIMCRSRRTTGRCMTTDRTADGALAPELEAIADAAHDRLHAQAGEDPSAIEEAARRVAEAASATIAAGARRQAQARSRHRVRAGHQPRRPTRTLPLRDRRHPDLARRHPGDVGSRDPGCAQRARGRAAAWGLRPGRDRRIAAERHLPAAGAPGAARRPARQAPGAAPVHSGPRAPPATRSGHTHPPGSGRGR